jgi:hypothetical protein
VYQIKIPLGYFKQEERIFSNTLWNESLYGIGNDCRYGVIDLHTVVYADATNV